MRRITLSIFFLLFYISSSGQELLISKVTEQGRLYFIKPVDFAGKKTKGSTDFTYVHQDTADKTVTINTTVESKELKGVPDEIEFLPSGFSLKKDSSTKVLFARKEGKYWKTRISYTIPFEEFKRHFFSADLSYIIRIDDAEVRMKAKNRHIKKYYEAFDVMLTEIKLLDD